LTEGNWSVDISCLVIELVVILFSSIVNHLGILPGIRELILGEMCSHVRSTELSKDVSCSRNIICFDRSWRLNIG